MLHHRPEILAQLIREERARELAAIHLARAADCSPGLRARLAAGLARAALVLHRDAASGAGLQPPKFSLLAPEDGCPDSGGRQS